MTSWYLVLDDVVTFKDMSGISEEQNELFLTLQNTHGCVIVSVLDFLENVDVFDAVLFFEPALYGTYVLDKCANKIRTCFSRAYVYADDPVSYAVTMAFAHSIDASALVTCNTKLEPHMLYANVSVLQCHHAAASVFLQNTVESSERSLVCLVPAQCAQPYRSRFIDMGYAGTVVMGTPAIYKNNALTNTSSLLNILANACMVYLGGSHVQAAHIEYAATGIVLVTTTKVAKILFELGIHADVWDNGSSGFCIRQPDYRETENVRVISIHYTVDTLAQVLTNACVYRSKLRKPAES
jgi:hypothetical protein